MFLQPRIGDEKRRILHIYSLHLDPADRSKFRRTGVARSYIERYEQIYGWDRKEAHFSISSLHLETSECFSYLAQHPIDHVEAHMEPADLFDNTERSTSSPFSTRRSLRFVAQPECADSQQLGRVAVTLAEKRPPQDSQYVSSSRVSEPYNAI